MFRCVTRAKGLAIDIDSINSDCSEWDWVSNEYRVVFFSSCHDNISEYKKRYGAENVMDADAYEKPFLPNTGFHKAMLNKMDLKETELIYVSGNKMFVNNALVFLSGVVWITSGKISYEDISYAPDMVCRSIDDFRQMMHDNMYVFQGENAVYYGRSFSNGLVFPAFYNCDDYFVPVYTLGRYFGRDHYMHHIHPYSASLRMNKNINSKCYGIFNECFAALYASTINAIKKVSLINAVCSVPVRPNANDRFAPILDEIQCRCKIENVERNFTCTREYSLQKTLPLSERRKNVSGAFCYDGDLNGKNIAIIDDIMATGTTIRECIRQLKKSGASQVYVIVLGVNQLGGNYWLLSNPQVICPKCGQKLTLFANSFSKKFFYSCSGQKCEFTCSFDEGIKIMCEPFTYNAR